MWQAVVPVIGSVIERLFPDPADQDRAKLELFRLEQEGRLAELTASKELALGQMDVNRAEAGTGNLFIGGWRPFIGWVCGVAVAYQYLLHPLMVWYATSNGMPAPPSVPSDDLFELVMLMLGVAGLRSFEKVKGVAR